MATGTNAFASAAKISIETRAQWRTWLQINHAQDEGIWLVSWKRHTARPAMAYEEMIEEALCFGWVDSTAKTLDEDRSMLYFAPRRKGSGWSRPNKQRIARLEAAGLIAEPGRRVIDAAKQDGSWTLLDDAEALIVPADLAERLDADATARAGWQALTASMKKQALAQIALAKRPDTRLRRIEQTVRQAIERQITGS